uniref:Uncharacterized protein n=1 Tax=Sciurus vulgaris TaxID=55149 RepID=A0A8D2BDT0_SCIVU
MSISALSLTRRLGGISGFLQLASLLGLLLLLFKAVHFLLHRQWLLKALQQFPSPPSHWFFGHKIPKDQELKHTLTWVGDKVRILVYDPDYLKVILGRSEESKYKYLLHTLNLKMLVAQGFSKAYRNDLLPPQDKWEQLIGQDSLLEIFQHVSLMTLDTIMKCAFKYQSSIQLDRNSQSYIKAVGDLNYFIFSRVRNVFHQNDTFYRLTTDGRLFHQACPFAHEHTDKVIRQRKAQLQNEGELEKVRRKRHLDFLDILLFAKMENGSSLSDKDLRAEVDTFMFEGHATTASGISWIFYALATHPEHQQKCREEVQSLLGDGASITWDHLDQMPYTTMCIKEALRLYPPVPNVSRDLGKPITFPDGRSLPKGIMVTLFIYGLHHNPKVWPNPEVFDPSRFAPGSSRHSHSFLPFSGGSR